jgi:hypothetical protein
VYDLFRKELLPCIIWEAVNLGLKMEITPATVILENSLIARIILNI